MTSGKEAVHFDDLSPALDYLHLKQPSERAERGIRERARQASVLDESLEVQGFHANDPITLSELGGQLVEHIVSQTGNAVVQACDLSARFLSIL
ncbi:hypothetical protein KSC_042960 [Ktedonobacter sp. SOSP1-52]|nr:hypothetical protein KSC_042960 [Ktedonobacter sp. SOSP1-52]